MVACRHGSGRTRTENNRLPAHFTLASANRKTNASTTFQRRKEEAKKHQHEDKLNGATAQQPSTMRTIRRISSEGRKAVKEMAATAEDHSSIGETASVVSDDHQHDGPLSSGTGPLDLLSATTYEDACEFCCHDCCSPSKQSKSSNGETYYTICQVRRHNTRQSCWLVAGDTIYDATPYLNTHPGGMESMLRRGGGASDVTRDLQFHSAKGQRMFKKYKVGKVRPCGTHEETGKKPGWFPW